MKPDETAIRLTSELYAFEYKNEINGFTVVTDIRNHNIIYDIKEEKILGDVTGYDVFYSKENGLIIFTKKDNGKKTVRIFDTISKKFVSTTPWILNEYLDDVEEDIYKGEFASFYDYSETKTKLKIFDGNTYREDNNLLGLRVDKVEKIYCDNDETLFETSNNGKKGFIRHNSKSTCIGVNTEYDEINIVGEIIILKKGQNSSFTWLKSDDSTEAVYGDYESITIDEKCSDIIYCKNGNSIDIFSITSHQLLGNVNAEEVSVMFSHNTGYDYTLFLRTKNNMQYNLYKAIAHLSSSKKPEFYSLLKDEEADKIEIIKELSTKTDDKGHSADYNIIFDLDFYGNHRALQADSNNNATIISIDMCLCNDISCDFMDFNIASLQFNIGRKVLYAISNGLRDLRSTKDYATDKQVEHIAYTLYAIRDNKGKISIINCHPNKKTIVVPECVDYSYQDKYIVYTNTEGKKGIVDLSDTDTLVTDPIYTTVIGKRPYFIVSNDDNKIGVLYSYYDGINNMRTIIPLEYKDVKILDKKIITCSEYAIHGRQRRYYHTIIKLENEDGSMQLATHQLYTRNFEINPIKNSDIKFYHDIIVTQNEQGTHIYSYADPHFKNEIWSTPDKIDVVETTKEIPGFEGLSQYFYLIMGKYYAYDTMHNTLNKAAFFVQNLYTAVWNIDGITYELNALDQEAYQAIINRVRYLNRQKTAEYLNNLSQESDDSIGDSGFKLIKKLQ